nr:InlB B-repeat-containing protein [uncultured Olsenella sp.]
MSTRSSRELGLGRRSLVTALTLALALQGFPAVPGYAEPASGAAASTSEPVSDGQDVPDGTAASATSGDAGAEGVEAADAAPADEEASPSASAEATAAEAPALAAAPPASAPTETVELWVDGSTGSDADDGSSTAPLKSLGKALELQAANPAITTIKIKGSFSAPAAATIPAGVTLVVAGVTTMEGTGADGITLASGSTLRCLDGATLTMSGFGTALTARAGSTITDGSYVFEDNAGGNVTRGIALGGTVRGSGGKDSLTITADDKNDTNFYESGITFENCTVSVNSQTRTWFDARDLNLKNASLTVAGFGQTYYMNQLNMSDSELTINKGSSWRYPTGMAIQSSCNIVNSHITSNTGSTAGISIGGNASTTVTVTNSTIELNNGGVGGLNVNTGKVVFNNSTLKGNGKNSGALFGAQGNGYIEFDGSSLVESPAAKNADTGAGQTGTNYVVLGGSHLVKYAPDYNSGSGSTVPTNGADNGNERLMLFTLADASTSALSPLNSNGTSYSYPVANASSDGQKHVWVPAESVTFRLNAPDAAQAVGARFSDGTVADKAAVAMRGYALADATPAAGSAQVPGDPTALGYHFEGWFYRDADGVERAYDSSVTVNAPLVVYAKWSSDSASYGIVYHSNLADDATYTVSANRPDRSATVASIDAAIAANGAFSQPGKIFKGWNTSADGRGEEHASGDVLTLPTDKSSVDLYAQWEDQLATVRFSANGGTFSDDSVFKTKTDVFSISTEANGGEVATVKRQAKVSDNQKLGDLLKSLDGSVDASTAGIATPSKDTAGFEGMASRAGFLLEHETKDLTFLGYVYGHEYSYWYDDPQGSDVAALDSGTTVKGDVTYYLKWKDDPSVPTIQASGALDADMWGDSKDVSNEIKFVEAGKEFSLTGAIDTTAIKDQMRSIEKSFGEGPEHFSDIALSGAASTFTAKITLPDEVRVPADPQVQVAGMGDLFRLDSVTASGQEVTVTFRLNDGFTNYQLLKDAVEGTGLAAGHATGIDDSNFITATISGLTLADGVQNGVEFAATGDVSGNFFAVAKKGSETKRFVFDWTSQQLEAGRDPRGDDVRQTMVSVVPSTIGLPADLEADGDTEHEAVHEVLQGEEVNLTGVVGVTSVKSQMEAIEGQFGTTPDRFESIALSDLSSGFVATLTLPEGVSPKVGLGKRDVTVEGFSDTFAVSDVTTEGNKVTVTMDLKSGIANYQQLKDAVSAVSDTMRLTVPTRVSDDVAAGTRLSVTGTVTGTFHSKATSEGGKTKVFAFTWNGEQTDEGRDAILSASDPTIQLTLATTSPIEGGLEGDMLVAGDTEHDAVIRAEKGSSFDLTGAIDVAPVKAQMAAIEARYPGVSHEDIKLDVRDFGFSASFTVPDDIELPASLDPSQVTTEAFGPGFKVGDVRVDGKTVTVSFVLSDPDQITTYDKLEAVVDAAGDAGENSPSWMRLVIPGFKVSTNAETGKTLTIVGTVGGHFAARATTDEGTSKVFSFVWNGTQWAPGKDAVATDDDTIQLSLEVTEPSNPKPNPKPKPNPNPNPNPNPTPDPAPQPGPVPALPGHVGHVVRKVLSRLPKTGDDLSPVAYVAVTGLAAASLLVAFRLRRRDDKA